MRRDTIKMKFVEAAHCLDEGSQMAEFHPPYDAMKRLLIAATVIFGVAVCCTAEAAMMHRSDNFYADQCLEMVSQLRFQKMDETALINNLLSNDLSGFPQKPRWVDGSGLSRYNLFSPDDMVYILNKIKSEQPWERIKTIFPTVGTGTLTRFESKNGKFIYAKTGSMGGVMNLSGYIYTVKKKWLIFSIMINNTQTPFSIIRKQMNGFLERVAEIN